MTNDHILSINPAGRGRNNSFLTVSNSIHNPSDAYGNVTVGSFRFDPMMEGRHGRFNLDKHEARNREIVSQYVNRPPFNRKPQERLNARVNSNFYNGNCVCRKPYNNNNNREIWPRTHTKSFRRVDYHQGFQHIAYMDQLQKIQNKEKQKRSRSVSPRLPRIAYLPRHQSPTVPSKFKPPVKKLEHNWKNNQIKKASKSDEAGDSQKLNLDNGEVKKNSLEINEPNPCDANCQNLDEIEKIFESNITPSTISSQKSILNDSSRTKIDSSHVMMTDLLNSFNFDLQFLGGIIEPEKASRPATPAQKKNDRKSTMRSRSVPSLEKVATKRGQNPRMIELFNPDSDLNSKQRPQNRPHEKSLIESIRQLVFQTKKQYKDEDEEWLDPQMKFPKETRNAIATMLSKKKEKPNVALQNSQTQTSPVESQTTIPKSDRNQNQNQKKMPCPKNLLCDKGVHSGKCSRSPRSKDIIKLGNDSWPGRALRVIEKSSSSTTKAPPVKTSLLSLSELAGINVKKAVEKIEPLLNSKCKL